MIDVEQPASVLGSLEARRPFAVRNLAAHDWSDWRRLWASYLTFYESTVPEDVAATTWSRILDPVIPLIGLTAEADGELLGFALCVVHLDTWSATPAAYLEDLFVAPSARRQGVGGALIDDLRAIGMARGWSTLSWHTRGENAVARALYERYSSADGFVRYRLKL